MQHFYSCIVTTHFFSIFNVSVYVGQMSSCFWKMLVCSPDFLCMCCDKHYQHEMCLARNEEHIYSRCSFCGNMFTESPKLLNIAVTETENVESTVFLRGAEVWVVCGCYSFIPYRQFSTRGSHRVGAFHWRMDNRCNWMDLHTMEAH